MTDGRNTSAARESGPRSSALAGAALDPITVEVITEGLNAIMAEMRGNVMRSSYSSVIGLVQDFSCGLFTPEGDLIAQGPDHPGHIIPLPWSVQASMEDLGDTLEEGDVILLNDPYRGGTHLNDVTVLWPVFLDGELFCFPAVRAHWADVGGISPGSYTGEATNIFYEGIRIPPIKIYERGELNVSAHRILMSNVRLPEEREGDFRACVGACRVAETRVRRARRPLRAGTASRPRSRPTSTAPSGACAPRSPSFPTASTWPRTTWSSSPTGASIPGLIALRLEIAGDRMIADFTRSSPQLPGVVNSTAAVAQGGVLIALKSALDSGGRINAGTFRPIECVTTPGTIVSVTYDAPANAHGEVRKRTVSVMLAALSRVAPELVTGDLCGTSFPNVIGGWDSIRSKRFLYLASPSGGNGGFLEADGPDALTNVDMGNLPLNHPTEEHEPIFPIRVEEIALRQDSEGAGRTRGGTGVIVCGAAPVRGRRVLRDLRPRDHPALGDRRRRVGCADPQLPHRRRRRDGRVPARQGVLASDARGRPRRHAGRRRRRLRRSAGARAGRRGGGRARRLRHARARRARLRRGAGSGRRAGPRRDRVHTRARARGASGRDRRGPRTPRSTTGSADATASSRWRPPGRSGSDAARGT